MYRGTTGKDPNPNPTPNPNPIPWRHRQGHGLYMVCTTGKDMASLLPESSRSKQLIDDIAVVQRQAQYSPTY